MHPDALDVCDTIDNDCSGTADDAFAASAPTDEGEEVFDSLDEALTWAEGLDEATIRVCAGIHSISSRVVGDGRALTLVGVSGRDATFLEEVDDSNFFRARDPDTSLTLEGLTLQNGLERGVRVHFSASLTLRRSRVQGMSLGAAIVHGTSSLPTVFLMEDTELIDNGRTSDDVYGGGLRIEGFADVEIRDSQLIENRAYRGGGLHIVDRPEQSSPVIEVSGSSLERNVAFQGGGLFAKSAAVLAFEDTEFIANEADFGGGARLVWGELFGHHTTSFVDNVALRGGGLSMFDSVVYDVTVSGSVADWGGGVQASSLEPEPVEGSAHLRGSIIESNSADRGGGMLVETDMTLKLVDCTVWSNTGVDDGGGAYVEPDALLWTVDSDWGTGTTDNMDWDVTLSLGTSTSLPAGEWLCFGSDGCQEL